MMRSCFLHDCSTCPALQSDPTTPPLPTAPFPPPPAPSSPACLPFKLQRGLPRCCSDLSSSPTGSLLLTCSHKRFSGCWFSFRASRKCCWCRNSTVACNLSMLHTLMVAIIRSDVGMLQWCVQSCSRQAEYAVEGQRAAAELASAHSQNDRLACSLAQAQAICRASDAQLKDLQRQHRKVTFVLHTSQSVSRSALDALSCSAVGMLCCSGIYAQQWRFPCSLLRWYSC